MAKQALDEKEDLRVALVRRVVPGKLVYVEMKPDEVYAIKLDNILIRQADGSYDHYRGERLSALGLDSGKKVIVATGKDGAAPKNLLVQASSRSIFGNFADYFKRRDF